MRILKMTAKLIIITLVTILCPITQTAKILHVMPFTAMSHYIAQKDLPLELARRGHDVYVITPYKEEIHPPTYHQILVDPILIWDFLFDTRPNVFSMMELNFGEFQSLLYKSGLILNDIVFNSTNVQTFINEDHKFDLVINEVFFQESLYMFAHKYQAPHVLITTFGNSFKANYFSSNPIQLSTVYHEYGYASDPFNFFGRLKNLYFCMYDLVSLKYSYLRHQEEYVKKYFKDLPTPVPSLEDLASNASLILMNSHFSIDTPTAYLPNFIQIAGLNIKTSNKTLPKDLQSILDGATEGIIYMSLGSNVRTVELDKDKLNALLRVFGELKYKVLMKWEDLSKKPKNVPSNVIMRDWFPQKEILAHPNVKLFIGHGGLLGLQEAVSGGVPILGVPVFGDQFGNLLQAKQSGYGEMIEYKNINENNLRYLINKMLNDVNYRKNAKDVANRFNDRPMNGLDTAIWWIEYVIRHKGADFMKTPALKMNFMSSTMLDVYLFLLIAPFLSIYILIKLIQSFFIKNAKPQKKKQKKN